MRCSRIKAPPPALALLPPEVSIV